MSSTKIGCKRSCGVSQVYVVLDTLIITLLCVRGGCLLLTHVKPIYRCCNGTDCSFFGSLNYRQAGVHVEGIAGHDRNSSQFLQQVFNCNQKACKICPYCAFRNSEWFRSSKCFFKLSQSSFSKELLRRSLESRLTNRQRVSQVQWQIFKLKKIIHTGQMSVT